MFESAANGYWLRMEGTQNGATIISPRGYHRYRGTLGSRFSYMEARGEDIGYLPNSIRTQVSYILCTGVLSVSNIH